MLGVCGILSGSNSWYDNDHQSNIDPLEYAQSLTIRILLEGLRHPAFDILLDQRYPPHGREEGEQDDEECGGRQYAGARFDESDTEDQDRFQKCTGAEDYRRFRLRGGWEFPHDESIE